MAMDYSEALSIVRATREKLRFLDQAAEALEAASQAQSAHKEAVAALGKVRDELKREQRRMDDFRKECYDEGVELEDDRARKEEAHKKRLGDMEAEAVAKRKELQDKYDDMQGKNEERLRIAVKAADNAEAALAEVVEELEKLKAARDEFMRSIGVK